MRSLCGRVCPCGGAQRVRLSGSSPRGIAFGLSRSLWGNYFGNHFVQAFTVWAMASLVVLNESRPAWAAFFLPELGNGRFY